MYYAPSDIRCRSFAPTERVSRHSPASSRTRRARGLHVMEFRKCSIAGVSYGLGTTQIGRGVLRRKGLPIPPEPVREDWTPFVNFVGKASAPS